MDGCAKVILSYKLEIYATYGKVNILQSEFDHQTKFEQKKLRNRVELCLKLNNHLRYNHTRILLGRIYFK